MNIYATLHCLLILVHYAVSDHEYDIKRVDYGHEYWCKKVDTKANDVDEESSKEVVKGTLRQVACDGTYLTLDCGPYRIIKILKANYGRKDINTCSKSEKLSLTSCFSKDTINVVQRRCEKKSMCKLKVDISIFGEPCRFVEKYLEVKYTCELAETAVACEGLEIMLKCEGEKYLNIANAIYEKHAACTGKFSLHDHQCTSTDSLEKVQESCQHRNRCKINNDGNDLGVPCPLKMRQLKIKYSCQDLKTDKEEDDDSYTMDPPKITNMWSTALNIKIDPTTIKRSEEYILQYRLSESNDWISIELNQSNLDFTNDLWFTGVSPGKTYDTRVVLKRMPQKKCAPFVRFTTRTSGYY